MGRYQTRHSVAVLLLLGLPVLLVVLPTEARAITFADGQVHVIDAANSFPFEDVTVQDDPIGATTTVQVAPR